MEKYNREGLCPKCGSILVETKYERDHSTMKYGDIRRTCMCCGYIWYEKPLDTSDSPEKEKP